MAPVANSMVSLWYSGLVLPTQIDVLPKGSSLVPNRTPANCGQLLHSAARPEDALLQRWFAQGKHQIGNALQRIPVGKGSTSRGMSRTSKFPFVVFDCRSAGSSDNQVK